MREDAPHWKYALRELLNEVRYVVQVGRQRRILPHYSPRWETPYQQERRWIQVGVFEMLTQDWLIMSRVLADREAAPSAGIIDART